MARDGMANLIARLRRAVDDTGSATVWSDNQLQDALDAHRERVHRENLLMEDAYTDAGSVTYYNYQSRFGNFEEGSAVFELEDGAGLSRAAGAYTVNYINGSFTMDSNQAGTALYLTGWTYDLNGAAAELWTERAGKVSSYYNVGLDGHTLSRAQWFDHCEKMAEFYARMARPKIVKAFKYGILE